MYPWYIELFKILERIKLVAYCLELSQELEWIHNVFHVSMLKKNISDPSHVLKTLLVELKGDLSFVVQPVEILDYREKILRNKVVPMVKVLWRSDRVEKMTGETKASMRKRYLHLFSD